MSEQYRIASEKDCRDCIDSIKGEKMIMEIDRDVSSREFEGRTDISEVIFRPGVRNIGRCAFINCTNLERVVMSDGVERIDNAAFMGCTNLREIVFPQNIEIEGSDLFRNCNNLTRVDICDELLLRQSIYGGQPLFPTDCPAYEGLSSRYAELLAQRQEIKERERVSQFRPFFTDLYTMIRNDLEFRTYREQYENQCNAYADVANWEEEAENEMLERMYLRQDNFIANVDQGGIAANFTQYNNRHRGEPDFTPLTWETTDRTQLARICNEIRCTEANATQTIRKCWRSYHEVMHGLNLKAVFNRMIAALRPNLVVPVPVIEGMNECYGWFVDNQFLEDPGVNDPVEYPVEIVVRWFKQSSRIRRFGNYCLPDCNLYEWGPFVWFLVKLFNDRFVVDARTQKLRRMIVDAGKQVPTTWNNE